MNNCVSTFIFSPIQDAYENLLLRFNKPHPLGYQPRGGVLNIVAKLDWSKSEASFYSYANEAHRDFFAITWSHQSKSYLKVLEVALEDKSNASSSRVIRSWDLVQLRLTKPCLKIKSRLVLKSPILPRDARPNNRASSAQLLKTQNDLMSGTEHLKILFCIIWKAATRILRSKIDCFQW